MSGQVGSTVTINGTGFTSASKVTFSRNKNASFTVISDTQIQAVVPNGAVTGKISVTGPGGSSTSLNKFTVTKPPKPTISSFSPSNGVVGATVIINGSNLSGATKVTFNFNKSATPTVLSDSQLQVVVPVGAVTGKVNVTTAGGTASSATNFVVVVAPRITSFSPSGGVAGTKVTIQGSHFVAGYTTVKFGTTAATNVTVNSPTNITVFVPTGAGTGLVSITVTNAAGSAVSGTKFNLK